MIRRWLARTFGPELAYGHLAVAAVEAAIAEELGG